MRIAVWHGDLSDTYLKTVVQLGADCIDFNPGDFFPGVKERGCPDFPAVLKIKKRIRSWGLEINRVTLPDITDNFMKDRKGAEKELENTAKALKTYGEAGIPLARQRFAGDTFPQATVRYRSVHRGGYTSRGERLASAQNMPRLPTNEEREDWWRHFRRVYESLVPLAEEYGVKLAIHPSDTPVPSTPFDGLGLQRVIDEFPSRNVGLIYCCGTRAEAGGSPLVLDEIDNFGCKGRIFEVHFRNVRGSLSTCGGFEELLLDDGDMNMFKVLLELHRVGFDGCLNPDHIPRIEGDGAGVHQGLAYSIGYIKALLAALGC